MDCIFCQIVAGGIPSHKLAEDESTLAFLDINPAGKGHALVIPKRHGENIFDTAPDDVAAVARTVQHLARQISAVLQPDGFNILQNNRPAAGQVIMHYHVHIIPRWNDDGIMKLWRPQPPAVDLHELATQIRAAAR